MEQEKQTITTISTFTHNVLHNKNCGQSDDNGFYYAAREILRNAKEKNATEAFIVRVILDEKQYMGIFTNADCFESREHLIECLKPSHSGINSGLQGSGMKNSMFGLVKSPLDAELLVLSKSTIPFGCRLRTNSDSHAIIENIDEFHDKTKQLLGVEYNNYNCFFFYKIHEYDTIQELNDKGEKKYTTTKGIVLDPSYMIGLSQLININGLNVRYARSTIAGILGKDNLGDAYSKPGGTQKHKVLTTEELDCFVADKVSYNVTFLNKIDGVDKEFTVNITHKVFPFITKDKSEHTHPLAFKTSGSVTEGTFASYAHTPKFRVLGYIDKNAISNMMGFVSRDVSRMYLDPMFSSRDGGKAYTHFGFYKRDFGSKEGFPIEKLKNYKYLPSNFNIENDENYKWRPKIVTEFKILPNKRYINNQVEFFNDVGSYDTCFVSDFRELFTIAAENAAANPPKELLEFKKRLKEHFPFDTTDLLTTPFDDSEKRKDPILDIYDSSTGKKISKVDPGRTYQGLQFRDKKGNIVKGDVEVMHPHIVGYHIIITDENLSTHLMVVNNLSYIDEKTGIPVPTTKNDFRNHGNRTLPKVRCFVKNNGIQYRLNITCNIPQREWKNESPHPKIKDADKKKDELKDTYECYDHLPINDYGVIRQLNGQGGLTLILNRDNPEIQSIITKTGIPEVTKLQQLWDSLFIKMKDIAVTFQNNMERVYGKGGIQPLDQKTKQELINDNRDPDYYLLNQALEIYLKDNKFWENIKKVAGI